MDSAPSTRIDLDKPRWDQDTYTGRAKRFFNVTDPRTILATSKQLDDAKRLVGLYRAGKEPANVTTAELYAAKKLYDSAFHPQTGEKQSVIGRMSFQVPGNMTIVGCMMTWYRTTPAIFFWQWVNQSFNAVVNYTNRNASSPLSNAQLGQAYVAATAAGVTAGILLNNYVSKIPVFATGMVGRLIPFIAVASANCVNIPLMRQHELKNGINVVDENGEILGKSKVAAKRAVQQVIPSRIMMATPAMTFPPLVMNILHKRPNSFVNRFPVIRAPLTVALTGLALVFSTPLACALFPQKSKIRFDHLEDELKESISSNAKSVPQYLFYNKGL